MWTEPLILEQLIFIIYGVITVFTGIILFVGLPDSPTKAWFFNSEERKLAVIRLASNQTGTNDNKVKCAASRSLFSFDYVIGGKH